MSGKPIDEGVLDRALCAWFNDATGAGLDGGPEHREWRTRMAAALTAAQQQGQAVACCTMIDYFNARACDSCSKNVEAIAFKNTAPPPSAPEGWVLVPREPTEAMIEAWENSTFHVEEGEVLLDAYTNMLAAAPALTQQPAPPSAPVGVEGEGEFWTWLRQAYNFTGAGNFTAYNMEVAYQAGRDSALAQQPAAVDEAMARRLDDYLGGEFDIRIGKQAAHAALCHALAQQPAQSAPVGVGERQALANVPFGWVKDAPSGIRSTLDFTTLPGVAEGWRVEGYRVVTLYSLPYLRQQPSAVDEAGGDDA